MDAHFLAGRTVVVAGAGIAGLSFATALRKQWPSNLKPPKITIYERDTKDVAMDREGYSLSLAGHDETGGLVALKDLGLLDQILGHAILGLEGDGCFKIWDSSWGELMSVRFKPARGVPTAGIRIARKHLRQTLIDAVGVNGIQWGVACVAANKLGNGRMRVQLMGNGHTQESTIECDLLVAADGASSKLRASLRPDDQLEYAGAIQLCGNAMFSEGIPKPVDNNWGLQTSAHGVCCFYSPVDKNTVLWALSIREPDPRPRLDRSKPESLQAVIDEGRKLGKAFSEPFLTIVNTTDPETVLAQSARDKKPFAHDDDAGPVVFIGDSNHAVSPFAGYGASLALKDGWDLAEQICKTPSLGDAVKAYDTISVPRAVKVLESSRWRINMGHGTGLKFLFFRALVSFGGFMLWLMGRS
jgi:2-polyprenyl-6-methoxyphenol hydroxylase-like FAD-dependent oxidoreductase